ncbi:37S ribosomal protein S23 [Paramyrothecium foliicola]|nr:37S ribosomal protein S23 [Paramyrothecium foliicola]
MASAQSLRCLVRPNITIATRIQPVVLSTTSFSTSASLAASAPPAVKSRRELPKQIKKSFKKKTQIVAVKKPNPGERKAFRKRIQLSNNSALPVSGTTTLEPATLATAENACTMVALPDQVVDQLRTLEAFKPTQSWGLFRRPHFLVRKETVALVEELQSASKNKETLSCVLVGSRNSGKSMVLLQAMSHALVNNWVVIHIPEAQDLTNGNTDYTSVPNTQPMQFAQPSYSLKLIQSILKANKDVLGALEVKKDWSRLTNLKKGATLADLLLSCKESEYAWPTLEALWTELILPGRPPVMFGLDGLAHINKMSEYRDPSYNQVHAHQLTIVRTFIDALSGKTKLPNGGAIIAATSESNVIYPVSQQLVLAQLEAGQAQLETRHAQLEADKAQLETNQAQLKALQAKLKADQTQPKADQKQLKARQARLEAYKTRLEARQAQLKAGQVHVPTPEIPKPDPYERKYDNRIHDALKNSRVLRVEGVSKEEGRVLMEYWGASGLARGVIDSRAVAEKWALGGHGLVGEMERVGLMTMRM